MHNEEEIGKVTSIIHVPPSPSPAMISAQQRLDVTNLTGFTKLLVDGRWWTSPFQAVNIVHKAIFQ